MKFIKIVMLTGVLVFSASALANDSFNIDVGSEYDSTDSAVFSTKMSAAFGQDKTNAFALEETVGQNTMRTNATYASSVFDSHYWKITGDFLYQNKKFDFGSDFGKHKEKVFQGAGGIAYRYNINQDFLKGIEMSSYMSYAPSKKSSYSPESFIYSETDQAGLYDVIYFYGRLAGSTSYGNSIDVDFSPWKDSLITLGVSHSYIKYDNKWGRNVTQGSFGGHAELNQVVSSWLKTNTSYEYFKDGKSYGGGLSVLLPSPKDMQFELEGNLSFSKANSGKANNFVSGLTFSSEFWVDDSVKTYHNSYDSKSLLSWTNKPVVRMRDVMVMAEPSYTKDGQVNTYLSALSQAYLRGFVTSQKSYKHGLWISYNSPSIDIKKAVFDGVVFSGAIYAHYHEEDDDAKKLTLLYNGHRPVVGTVGKNWDENNTCKEKEASKCLFEVKLNV